MQQNTDGSWSEAVPLGWQGPKNTADFEVYRRGSGWVAYGYQRAKPSGHVVSSRNRIGLVLRARWAVGLRTPVTFLWD